MFTKRVLIGILCLGLVIFALTPDATLAQGVAQKVRAQDTASLQSILSIVSYANTVMHIATLVVLYFLQYLMQSDFFSNPMMISAMNTIWQLSRDLMNVIFAIMAVGVGIYTIVTANKQFVTDKIQMFVVAVVLVNLSWFFPRVIIDISNILTATVYSIPQMMPNFTCMQFDDQAPGGTKPCTVVKDIYIFGNEQDHAQFCGGYGTTPGSASCHCYRDIGCYVEQDFNSARNSFGVGHLTINGLIVNFTKILTLPKIPQALAGPGPLGAGQSISVTLQFLLNVGIALIIQVAVLFPMLALAFGLLIRIIVIWVATAFMPFIFLGLIINGKLGTNVVGNDQDVWGEFIGAVFLPVFVAIPITIGFIMLTTVVQIPIPGTFNQTWNLPLISGIGSWWGMLWLMAAVAILWKGSFSALDKMNYGKEITGQIKNAGESLFSAAKTLPMLTPIPLPNGGQGTLGSLVNAPQKLASDLRAQALGSPIVKVPGKNGNQVDPNNPAQINTAISNINKDNAKNTNDIVKAINDLKNDPNKKGSDVFTREIKQTLNLDVSATTKQVLDQLKAIAEKDSVNGFKRDKLSDINDLITKVNNGTLKD